MYVSKAEQEEIQEDAVLMEGWASGQPAQKQVRFEHPAIHSEVADTPIVSTTVRRRPTYTRTVAVRKRKGSSKKKDSSKNSQIQELGESAERYKFLNSLARASAGITFGQIANGDIESVIKEFLSVALKRRSKSAVHMASEQEKNVLHPNRHQVVQLTLYAEPVFGVLGSGTIPNVMPDRLANKLKLSLNPTGRPITVADGSTGGYNGIASTVPVGFGKIFVRLKFRVIESVPYDLIIGTAALVQIRARINMYSQTVQVRLNCLT